MCIYICMRTLIRTIIYMHTHIGMHNHMHAYAYRFLYYYFPEMHILKYRRDKTHIA